MFVNEKSYNIFVQGSLKKIHVQLFIESYNVWKRAAIFSFKGV